MIAGRVGEPHRLPRLARHPRVARVVQQVDATRDLVLTRDAALLAARLALAVIFVYHGAYTLFGAFGGPGVNGSSTFFTTVAHLHPGVFFAGVAGTTEFFGGIAVGLGLFSRLAAAVLAGDMAVAMATVTVSNGISSTAPGGGYELNLALGVLSLVVAALGAGRLSVGTALRWARSRP